MEKKTILKDSWVWNNEVSKLVQEYMKGWTLNIPCGLSKLGDVRADLDPKEKGIDKVEMNKLPYKPNTFDTVIQDPPWKIGFYHRFKPFFECVRVCKVGGLVIYNAYWIPTSKYVKLKEVIIRQDKAFTNTSIISIFQKIAEVPEK